MDEREWRKNTQSILATDEEKKPAFPNARLQSVFHQCLSVALKKSACICGLKQNAAVLRHQRCAGLCTLSPQTDLDFHQVFLHRQFHGLSLFIRQIHRSRELFLRSTHRFLRGFDDDRLRMLREIRKDRNFVRPDFRESFSQRKKFRPAIPLVQLHFARLQHSNHRHVAAQNLNLPGRGLQRRRQDFFFEGQPDGRHHGDEQMQAALHARSMAQSAAQRLVKFANILLAQLVSETVRVANSVNFSTTTKLQ